MKSKSTAYLLWFFFGVWGMHRFYLGHVVTGILYFFTLGFFGIGWFVDLFILGGQVDAYNALYRTRMNTPTPGAQTAYTDVTIQLQRLADLLEKGMLTEAEFEGEKKKLLG